MNDWLDRFKTTIEIKAKGKNIERFIKRLISLDIELLEIKYIKYNEIIVKIFETDLEQIEQVKTIYDIELINYYGLKKYMGIIKKNKLIILTIIFSFGFILYLSNTIFSIDVIHNDKNIRELILNELKENDIKVYSNVKNYKYINKVKQKILNKYKDKIEWLEIENSGTKYIVRLEERKINNIENTSTPRNLVASKNALIISVEASSGEIIRNKNDYVRKGDIIVTGDIKLNETVKNKVSALGKVYGEVWYKVIVEYPLKYNEEKITNDVKNTYSIKFLNNKISLYNKYFTTKESILYQDRVIPFIILKEKKNKVVNIEQTLTKEEAINKAIDVSTEKMKSKLSDNEYIIDTKKLKVEANESKIILELFFTVCEDITDYSLIEGE